MANIKSQIKRNRQNEKHRQRNRAVRSDLRTRLKNVDTAVADGNSDEAVAAAIKTIDKAASKGVIHKNKAARDKSRLIARAKAAAEG